MDLKSIDELTIGEAKNLIEMAKALSSQLGSTPQISSDTSHVYEVGQNYLVETVTKYFLGKLVRVTEQELLLDEASWIADTGRYNECLRDGVANEVEPCPGSVIVGRGAIVSASLWTSPLLRVVK